MLDGQARADALAAPAPRGGGAHWAHVAMVALHTLCCALPVLASLMGLAASAALVGGVLRIHDVLHGREFILLGASAVLVAFGGLAEWRLYGAGRRRISVLFAISLACFAFNAAIVFGHRARAAEMVVAPVVAPLV